MMRDLSSLTIFFAVAIGTAVSKPLWSTLVGTNYLYPTPGIGAQPQYIAAYQNTHSPYYVYNVSPDIVYSNVGGVSSTLQVSGKPEIAHIPDYSIYYGTPIYNIRFPLNPIYPVLTPSHPAISPVLPPTSTKPFDENDYDGIEKLDMKVETETKKPEDSVQDDSITVEAI